MSDCLRLYIHESSTERCLAKGVHRSGSRLRPVSCNDVIYGTDNETVCGIVTSVELERIDRENWLYRVSYVPAQGTLHPIDSYVVWRQPGIGEQPTVAPQVTHRVPQVQVTEHSQPSVAPNGRKRNSKKSVNGQLGNGAQASAPLATAAV
jgi:hypothetical protein